MIAATAFLFATILSYAPTPEAAAKLVVYPANGSPVRAERTNVAGRYATVLMRNAMMEGLLVRVPVLLERFSFGWQPLESLDFRCRLDVQRISPHDESVLMRGMPKAQNEQACGIESNGSRDFGPVAKVEALRKRSEGPLLPAVIIVHDYALVNWYGAGGGQRLYKWKAGQWHFLAGGGGEMGSAQMETFGVPKADWCTFGVYYPKCPRKL